MKKSLGYLRLMRPANIVTAISDILAGIAISGFIGTGQWQLTPVVLLILTTIGLYGGGVVMNDFFDADLDREERPERPIPSGLVTRREAFALGMILLVFGIVAATFVYTFNHSFISGVLAVVIAIAALVYDRWGKHHSFFGPLNMGICRGLNLLLGMSILPEALIMYGVLGIVPVIYIAAITMISRGEVHGGQKTTLFVAAFLYLVAIASILYVSVREGTMRQALVFILLWAVLIFPPLWKAIDKPEGKYIGRAVKFGVIALIVMNAAWAAAFSTFYFALIIVLLLPISVMLAKLFAVT